MKVISNLKMLQPQPELLIKPEAGQVWKAAYRSGRQFGDEYEIIHVSEHFGFCALKNRDGDYHTFSEKGKLCYNIQRLYKYTVFNPREYKCYTK